MIAPDERQDEFRSFKCHGTPLSSTLSELPHEMEFGHIPEFHISPPFMTSDIIYIYLLKF